MKCRYKREAWYLDEDILIHGHVDKYGFHPEKNIPCGFGLQKVNRKGRNKEWFYSLKEAYGVLGIFKTAGGRSIYSLDFEFRIPLRCNTHV